MEQLRDQARFDTKVCESITLHIRQLAADEVKLIWCEGESMVKNLEEDDRILVVLLGFAGALNKLTFPMGRDMAQRAIHRVSNTDEK
ncbi:uncharacterized protein Z520_11727 [Fonsecaea multimorphosa CBS 102226]|uniref:Uncharacterized protein n=1 Tax=Fonsecaea multimorphosa CBS 102226 TaxID=1442371 RepID=A0A0D2I5K2_9EURO|nr:uncharacterized protein Z520_11727 [Fonsecaea multimorphosa CBS 102226]KIX92551.1 hypothetical protein Z520_11727 [Fonsecaea multimorphosa CBS 102226]